ncbi:MAG: FHA domain-containing protein [Oligoflexia bacterium]|nr:FHA domain-containing protein [Oligoflexia bacterium]
MAREFRLEILKGNDAGAQFRVTGERVLFGRAANCDIVVTDVAASRNHAELIRLDDGYLLRDLNSSNGIMVNGRKVSEHPMQAGDVFTIGDHAYKYGIVEKKEPRPSAPQKLKTDNIPGLGPQEGPPPPIPTLAGGGKSKRPILYGAVALVLILVLVVAFSEDDTQKKTGREQIKKDPFAVEDVDVIYNRKIEPGMEELYNRANEYYFSGRREFRLKNYSRALEEFRRALTFYPKHGQAKYYARITDTYIEKESKRLMELGKKLMSQLRYENAIKCFREVMDFNVQKPDSQIFREAEKMKAIAEKRKVQINN